MTEQRDLVKLARDCANGFESIEANGKDYGLLDVLADEITRLQAELRNLSEANDWAEKNAGISSDGCLWRFWAGKSQGLAETNSRLKGELSATKDKLAKAVEALGYYALNDDGGSIARTTLKELTGGKDG